MQYLEPKVLLNGLKKKIKIDFCLVGEPTNPNYLGEMIKVGRRGSINGEIIVKEFKGMLLIQINVKTQLMIF